MANREGGRRNSGKLRRAKRKVCAFCMDKSEYIDYKDINKLRKRKDSSKKNFWKLCKASKRTH